MRLRILLMVICGILCVSCKTDTFCGSYTELYLMGSDDYFILNVTINEDGTFMYQNRYNTFAYKKEYEGKPICGTWEKRNDTLILSSGQLLPEFYPETLYEHIAEHAHEWYSEDQWDSILVRIYGGEMVPNFNKLTPTIEKDVFLIKKNVLVPARPFNSYTHPWVILIKTDVVRKRNNRIKYCNKYINELERIR